MSIRQALRITPGKSRFALLFAKDDVDISAPVIHALKIDCISLCEQTDAPLLLAQLSTNTRFNFYSTHSPIGLSSVSDVTTQPFANTASVSSNFGWGGIGLVGGGLAIAFALTKGNGGEGGHSPPAATDMTAPLITGPSGAAGAIASTKNIAENTSAVFTFTANESVTWSIAGGVDAGKFSINNSTGALSFKISPNYEVPSDTGSNNVYDLQIRAHDAAGNSSTQNLVVTLSNVDETYMLGQERIDLGAYGQLIAPVKVDGENWFYYWDLSGDGTSKDIGGSLNDGRDYVTHSLIQ